MATYGGLPMVPLELLAFYEQPNYHMSVGLPGSDCYFTSVFMSYEKGLVILTQYPLNTVPPFVNFMFTENFL